MLSKAFLQQVPEPSTSTTMPTAPASPPRTNQQTSSSDVAVIGLLGVLAGAVITQGWTTWREKRQAKWQKERDDDRWRREREEEQARWERERLERKDQWEREDKARAEQWGREDQARLHGERMKAYSKLLNRCDSLLLAFQAVEPRPPQANFNEGPEISKLSDELGGLSEARQAIDLIAPDDIRESALTIWGTAIGHVVALMFAYQEGTPEGLAQSPDQIQRKTAALTIEVDNLRTKVREDLGVPTFPHGGEQSYTEGMLKFFRDISRDNNIPPILPSDLKDMGYPWP